MRQTFTHVFVDCEEDGDEGLAWYVVIARVQGTGNRGKVTIPCDSEDEARSKAKQLELILDPQPALI